MAYYRSLVNTIKEIKEEKRIEKENAIKEHLDKRIEAMVKDQKRLREMFPDITEEEWHGNTK